MSAPLTRDADATISNNERDFILKALKEGQRIDGRTPYELRHARFTFALDDSSAAVQLGGTRCLAVVTATLDAPFGDRPSEGTLRFNVEFSPMASPAFEPGRPGEDAIEVARLVERGLRETRAVDLEALVVLAGRKVWHLRVDVHVLDHQGNLADACGLAALAALMAFRRPDVTGITVHPPEQREPVPLSIHHLPLPISFALFEEGELLLVDPSLKEEAAAAGKLTVTQNAFGELCSIQKIDGCGLGSAQLMRCIRLAAQKVEEQTAALRKALAAHDVARVQARVRRQPGAAVPGEGAPARGVTVLRADQLLPAVAAVRGAGGGGALALDLDALPAGVRSLLAQQAGADEAEDMSEDEGAGSSSSDGGSSSDEDGSDVGSEEEAAAAAVAAAAADLASEEQRQRRQRAAPAPAEQQQQQLAATAGSGKAAAPAKKRRGPPGGGSREEQRDELAAIAGMIARAGGGDGGGLAGGGDLAAAVKKKKKKQPGVKAAGK
ncbi:exosome complex component RRP45A isoform X1 [Micractinium conductrix]|uniref:Exosome complex component RRP45A isoform X1 n=1 Tax=Micractinium conductrix TaxID=554055 RepID=A0A2P6VLC2_9CHLO|nr:exosome complex component RRP45A isoform X1 [Micractinium conductrix]|eukprot:PSC74884.1 exosome complex component RRP45A isoform X1 [Micractinium conductrix]